MQLNAFKKYPNRNALGNLNQLYRSNIHIKNCYVEWRIKDF